MEKENGSKNIFSNLSGSQNHWFLTRHQTQTLTTETPAFTHRLNDLDSDILKSDTPTDSKTQTLRIQFQIKDREEQLEEINKMIASAESSGDQQLLFSHRAKKQRIENELREYKRQIASGDLTSRYPAKTGFAKKISFLGKMKRFVQRYFLAKISKKFNSLVQISDSLEALQDLNSNVDDLIKIKAPYGETVKNYEKLTEYLNRANKIHSKISRTMKG